MELPPYRPPSEAFSYLIRVVRGCNWNKCAFCSMYKNMKFEQRLKDEIMRDIDEIPKYFSKKKSAFLGDSNPLIHKDI
ncbi:MAG: radical SAM protein, partial [Archaeoglobaceae archaeon]